MPSPSYPAGDLATANDTVGVGRSHRSSLDPGRKPARLNYRARGCKHGVYGQGKILRVPLQFTTFSAFCHTTVIADQFPSLSPSQRSHLALSLQQPAVGTVIS